MRAAELAREWRFQARRFNTQFKPKLNFALPALAMSAPALGFSVIFFDPFCPPDVLIPAIAREFAGLARLSPTSPRLERDWEQESHRSYKAAAVTHGSHERG
jgi:hypothetical protein